MLRSQFGIALISFTTFFGGSIVSQRSVQADYPTLSAAGRYFGWGWGKGYHAYDNCGGNCYGESSQIAAQYAIPTQSHGYVSHPHSQPYTQSQPQTIERSPARAVTPPPAIPSVMPPRNPEPSVPSVVPAQPMVNPMPMNTTPMESVPRNPMNPKIPLPGNDAKGGAEFLPPPRSAQRMRTQPQQYRPQYPAGPWADYGR